MYKIPLSQKIAIIINSLAIEVALCVLLLSIPNMDDKNAFILYFIAIPIMFIMNYYIIRAIRYLYLMNTSDFNEISYTHNGLLLKVHRKNIMVPYSEIKLISFNAIGILKGSYIDEVVIETENKSIHGFIYNGEAFQEGLPDSVITNRYETKNFKW